MALPPALDPRRRRRRGLPPASPAGFQVLAVHLAGDVMLQSTGYGSTEVSRSGTLCMIFRPGGGEGVQTLFGIDNSALSVAFTAPDEIDVDLNAGEGGEGSFSFDMSFDPQEGAFLPIMLSWSTDHAAGQKVYSAYIGDVALVEDAVVDADAAFDVALNTTTWKFGGNAMPNLVGDLAEIFFQPGVALDFSDVANRRKFVTAAGKPVDLGPDGSLPLGEQPLIYLSVRPGDLASAILQNRGTGDDFAETGAGDLTLADASPSD